MFSYAYTYHGVYDNDSVDYTYDGKTLSLQRIIDNCHHHLYIYDIHINTHGLYSLFSDLLKNNKYQTIECLCKFITPKVRQLLYVHYGFVGFVNYPFGEQQFVIFDIDEANIDKSITSQKK